MTPMTIDKDGLARLLDFRVGSTWGRALHGHTFRQVRPARLFDRVKDKLQGAYRAAIMVHYPRRPQIGDRILWEANSGTVTAIIYDVEPCRDPDDMFTLFVRIIPTALKEVR